MVRVLLTLDEVGQEKQQIKDRPNKADVKFCRCDFATLRLYATLKNCDNQVDEWESRIVA